MKVQPTDPERTVVQHSPTLTPPPPLLAPQKTSRKGSLSFLPKDTTCKVHKPIKVHPLIGRQTICRPYCSSSSSSLEFYYSLSVSAGPYQRSAKMTASVGAPSPVNWAVTADTRWAMQRTMNCWRDRTRTSSSPARALALSPSSTGTTSVNASPSTSADWSLRRSCGRSTSFQIRCWAIPPREYGKWALFYAYLSIVYIYILYIHNNLSSQHMLIIFKMFIFISI